MSKSVGKVVRNSVLQSANNILTTAFNFTLTLVYTHTLRPEQYGSLVTSQAMVLVWMLAVDLGLSFGLISALTAAEGERSEFARQGFRSIDLVVRVLLLRCLGALLGVTGVVILAWNSPNFWQDMAFLPYLFAFAMQQTLTAYGNLRNRQGLGVGANLAGIGFSVVVTSVLAFRGASLTELLLVQSLGGFLGAAVIACGFWWSPSAAPAARREQRTRRGTWGPAVWQALFRDSWPYALVFAAGVLWQRLDQLSASHFLGLALGGNYAVAVRLAAIPVALMGGVSIAIFPDLQRVGRDAPEKIVVYVGAVTKLFFRFGLPLAFALMVAIMWAIVPFFPKYAPARDLLFWFVPGIWSYWLYNFVNGVLFSLRRYRITVLAHFGAVALYALALVVLTPAFGLRGVALSYDIFCLSLFGFCLWALVNARDLPANYRPWGGYSRAEGDFLTAILHKFLPRKASPV